MDTSHEESLFGRWLRRRRKTLLLTQKELARRVGCSSATIRKLEADERHPSPHVAAALARELGVPPEERAAFVRFARGGWSEDPVSAAPADMDHPWMRGGHAAQPPVALPAEGGPRPAAGHARAEPAPRPHRRRSTDVVAREDELGRLGHALERAVAGEGSVMLVAGDAGQGKTTLLTTFAERALDARADLVIAMGACNAYTGSGDPFLPVRQILEQLTGDVTAGERLGAHERERAERLRRFLPRAVEVLADHGAALVGTLLSVEPLRRRLADAGLDVPPAWAWSASTGAATRHESTDGASQAAFRAAATRVISAVADRTPLLLLLDDLQWLDPSSIDVLLHLTRAVTDHRVLVLGAYRPADIAPGGQAGSPGMARVLHEVERVHGDAVIDLDRSDGRRFLEAWLDTQPNSLGAEFREALWKQTGGHPLFTVELLRAMQERGDIEKDASGRWTTAPTLAWDALPRRVSGALAERVERLEPDARQVLRVASVEGGTFTAEVVARVLERNPREVVAILGGRLARDQHLVSAAETRRNTSGLITRFRFRHDLIQRYVYDTVDEGERGYLHEAVATALEALLGDEADPLALARHFTRARLPERAAVYFRDAGDRARKAGALDQAVDAYRAALEHWPDEAPTTRAALLRDLGECRWLRGEDAEGRSALEEALAIYDAQADVRSAAMVRLFLGATFHIDGDWDRALTIRRQAVADLERGPETPELALAQSGLAAIYQVGHQHAEALAWAHRALDTADRVHAEDARAQAMARLGVHYAHGPERREEGLRMLEASHAAADGMGLWRLASTSLYNLAYTLRALGRTADAERHYEEALAYARRHSLAHDEAMARYRLWQLAWRTGRWTEALGHRADIVRLTDGTDVLDTPVHQAVTVLAAADLDLGQLARARSLLDAHVQRLERVSEPQYRSPHLRVLLRAAAVQGRTEDADAHALALAEVMSRVSMGVDTLVLPALSALVWLATRSSRALTEAARPCLHVIEHAEAQYGSSETRAALAEARGALSRTAGDQDAASRHLVEAAKHWHDGGLPFDEARARGAAGRALAQAGRSRDAADERRRADVVLAKLADELPSDELRASFSTVRQAVLAPGGPLPL